MRRITVLLTALAFAGAAMAPAEATTARIGGPCKKVHQVDWIKGVRAQCTWVPAANKKKGKLIWKKLAPAKTTATKAELLPTPSPTATPDTPTATIPPETATATP